ncbi:hypothetical protein DACRYDRAFT_30091, partial [Dacryopinax primogenitus]
LLDFYYLACLEAHSDQTIVFLRQNLLMFHANKEAFICLGTRKSKDTNESMFQIPKLHSFVHYMSAIMEADLLDNWDTQMMEGLHKTLAKIPFCESSGRESTCIQEMAAWIARHEKLAGFQVVLEWRL